MRKLADTTTPILDAIEARVYTPIGYMQRPNALEAQVDNGIRYTGWLQVAHNLGYCVNGAAQRRIERHNSTI